jgi:6-phosphogluconolactonase
MTEQKIIWHEFTQRHVFTEKLSERIAQQLEKSSQKQAHVLFGVSGGSTPLPVYQHLSHRPLDWQKIKLVVVDERYVPTNHPDSNEANIRQAFSSGRVSSSLNIIGLWSEQHNIDLAAIAAHHKLVALNDVLDVVLLGMGEDGHFASLFTSAERFEEATTEDSELTVYPIEPMPEHAAHSRLSMSSAYIQRSGRIILAITGEKKRAVLKQAIADGDIDVLAIAALFQSNSPSIEIFWSAQ